MKRNLARLILILSVIAWAIIAVSVLVTPVKADSAPAEEPKEDDGRIPGDDVPATERCYMTDEEVREDYENQKISEALLAKNNPLAIIRDGRVTASGGNLRYARVILGIYNRNTSTGRLEERF